MIFLASILASFQIIFTTSVFFYLLLGVVAGMVIGALPGLTAVMAVAILTPLTYWLDPSQGLAMLLGVYNSAIWAGGISAVLINTPGTPASIMQGFDGYEMTKRGDVGLALSTNTIYSCFGGLIGTVVLTILSFPIARFALKFGPTEMFALTLFGLSMMISASGANIVDGLFSGVLGLMVSNIGLDPMIGTKRFTFNNINLLDGFSFVVIMVGMFGIGEVLVQVSEHKSSDPDTFGGENAAKVGKGRVFPNGKEIRDSAIPVILSSLFSVFVGAVPGTGGDIASIICWNQTKALSKDPDEFGKGSFTGLAVPSAANNSAIGGALITMMTLGIPGDSVTAILIGALMMYGMTPGPSLFTENASFVYTMMALMFVAYLVILVLGLLTAKVSSNILKVKKQYLWIIVTGFCILGSFAVSNSVFDVCAMLGAAVLGFFFKKANIPLGPFILAVLLGDICESNFRRALAISHGNFSIFFTKPISLVLIICTVAALTYSFVAPKIREKKKMAENA